jgi:hypothetical protein
MEDKTDGTEVVSEATPELTPEPHPSTTGFLLEALQHLESLEQTANHWAPGWVNDVKMKIGLAKAAISNHVHATPVPQPPTPNPAQS